MHSKFFLNKHPHRCASAAAEVHMLHAARSDGVDGSLYLLNLRSNARIQALARDLRVPVREYRVFHELLTDVLHAAGLPGPVRELAAMRPCVGEEGAS